MYSKFLAFALVFGIAIGCDPRDFNVYVLNDFACSNSDVEGRLAAGGSISINNYAVGCQIYNTDPSTTCIKFGSVRCADHPTDEPSLIAGTSIKATNAQVYAGSVVYGTTLTTSSFTTVLDCAVRKDSSYGTYIKTAGFPALVAASSSYAARAATGTTTIEYKAITFTTTSDKAVFSVAASDLAVATGITLNAPLTATEIVINVSGTTVSLSNFGHFGQFKALKHSIIWNFVDATSVATANIDFWGALLAPKADLITQNGVFNGQIFVKSVSTPAGMTCGQFNHAPFGAYVPPSGICGNGVVDSGEQCDGGVCCKSDCTFVSLASNTTCRAAAGECDIPEICSGSSGACPTDAFYAAETPCGSNFGVCDVQLKEHCPGDSAFCKRAPAAYIFYWDAFNVISFDSFTANGGDVEGRLAARNNVNLQAFTLGLETLPTDPVSYYELVVAGNGSWTDGSVNKGRSGINLGNIAVAGTFTAPDYLFGRRDASAYVPYSLFDSAKTYFVSISNKLASLGTNAAATVVYGDGLLLTCTAADSLYHVKVDAAVLSTTNWYLTSGCTFNAAWVIDVTGTGNVNFQGSPFSGVVERVIYNIPNGNSITANNGVAGNILAPLSTYTQYTGVTYGKLIVGNVAFARQNNKPNCIDFKTVTITNKVLKKVNLGDNFVYVVDIKGYAVGDQVCISGNCRKVLKGEIGDIDGDGKIDNVVFVDAPFATTAAVMSDAVTTIAADATRAEQIPIENVSASSAVSESETEMNNFPSDASALFISSALFAVVAMFF